MKESTTLILLPAQSLCGECGFQVVFDSLPPKPRERVIGFKCANTSCVNYNTRYWMPLQVWSCERAKQ